MDDGIALHDTGVAVMNRLCGAGFVHSPLGVATNRFGSGANLTSAVLSPVVPLKEVVTVDESSQQGAGA